MPDKEGRSIAQDEYKKLVKEAEQFNSELSPLERVQNEDCNDSTYMDLQESINNDSAYKQHQEDFWEFKKQHMVWAQVVGMVEMCKVGGSNPPITSANNIFQGYKGFIPYIYASDGNTMIIEDCYGDGMVVHDPKEMLERAKQAREAEPYRRLDILIGLLEGALQNDSWHDLKVLSYGH
jgi:hypothetical protein